MVPLGPCSPVPLCPCDPSAVGGGRFPKGQVIRAIQVIQARLHASAALLRGCVYPWESMQCMFSAYLLVFWRRGKNVVHQDGYQFCYSMHARSECSVLRRETWGLSLGFGLVQPFPRYRVYDVEYSQFVCAGCFLEVGEEFLDEDRFVLAARRDGVSTTTVGSHQRSRLAVLLLTWTLATQSAVMFAMREPDTPGGFSESMAWRPVSSSATTEDAMAKYGRTMTVEERSSAIRQVLGSPGRRVYAMHFPRHRSRYGSCRKFNPGLPLDGLLVKPQARIYETSMAVRELRRRENNPGGSGGRTVAGTRVEDTVIFSLLTREVRDRMEFLPISAVSNGPTCCNSAQKKKPFLQRAEG